MNLNTSMLPPGKILVEKKMNEEKIGSIYVPTEARTTDLKGKVVKMGNCRKNELLRGLGEGSEVMFSKYHREIEVEKQMYLYIDVNDVLLYKPVF